MFIRLLTAVLLLSLPAKADVPRVVTDIAPVHSLVAMVMGDVGAPDLLMKPGASPHHYAMRPSEAAGLSRADLVVWIGADLTPWLEDPIATLAPNAVVLHLTDHAAQILDGGEDEDHADDTHSDDHDGHDDNHGHDDHGHGDHDVDPHLWLDPLNAAAWIPVIAEALADLDPARAADYRKNAETALDQIAALTMDLEEKLAPLSEISYAVHHDAYGYLEARFGLSHAFAVTDTHAVTPGPARIAYLREAVTDSEVSCILTDGIEPTDILETVTEGHQVSLVIADPLGSDLTPGPLLYLGLMGGLSLIAAGC